MPDHRDIGAAFDRALRQVDRAIAADLRGPGGETLRPQLERLRGELAARRDAVPPADAAALRDWVGETVRWVSGWAPDTHVALLAAMGAIARAGAARRA